MAKLRQPIYELPGWFEYADLGKDKNQIHFTPANGIPVFSYSHFFEKLSPGNSLYAADTRNNWPGQSLPAKQFSWLDHADDLIQRIESRYSKPVIGVGHSMGGTVTAIAAVKRPELFTKLVLIEPATAPSRLTYLLLRYSPACVSNRSVAFIRKSHQRQYTFASRQAFIDRYRDHPTYQRFTQRAFSDFVESGLVDTDHGRVHLLCHPHWESHNFRSVEYLWRHLHKLNHPCLLLRAEHSYLYSPAEFERQSSRLGPNIESQQIPSAGHLATHEKPQQLAQQIRNWL